MNQGSPFRLHDYTGRAYTAPERIVFSPPSGLADMDEEMRHHEGVRHIQVSGLTQDQFDRFVERYADRYASIYFFQNPRVSDLSALAKLKRVEYLLFYNLKSATALWDMRENAALKGIFISESKALCADLSALPSAPALEECILHSSEFAKYTVNSLEPLGRCPHLRRVRLHCNTAQKDFEPAEFSFADVFEYRVDRKRNY